MGKFRLHLTKAGRKVTGLLLLFLLSIGLANAQPRLRTGHVVDENGKPLAGVSVTVKGQKNGTTTDENGNYSINADGANLKLIFSFVGYGQREILADQAGTVALSTAHSTID